MKHDEPTAQSLGRRLHEVRLFTLHSSEGAAYVREHLDEVQALRAERGVPLLDPADPMIIERYGL